MEADFSVELGAEDEALEIPWASPDGKIRYYDLRGDPGMIEEIPEAAGNHVLKEFLIAINARSVFASAKCDTWFTRELNPEEEIFGMSGKFGSYVDLVVADEVCGKRMSFEEHERLLRDLTRRLGEGPEVEAAAEFILRRCYFHAPEDTEQGVYFTLYVFGYGNGEEEARRNWERGMTAVQEALLDAFGG